MQPPFIYLTDPEEEAQLAAFDAAEGRLQAIRAVIETKQGEVAPWPETLTKVAVPWIWNDSELKTGAVEFQQVLQLDSVPTKAIVRFVGMGTARVRLNGSSLGASYSLDRGVLADVRHLLIPGDNVISAVAEGKGGFAFLLEYEINGESRSLSSGHTWMSRASGGVDWHEAVEVYNPEHEMKWTERTVPENLASLTRDVEKIEAQKKAFLDTIPAAMVMREKTPPRPATILVRGEYDAPGDPVERNTPAVLPALAPKDEPYSRMDLAEWLVAPNHPLTARVAVNRVWQQFFGVGLVKTSEDFGAQGEAPSHPDLLDDLALRFMESGWNLKAMVRDMVLSNTYKQDSNAAPEEFRRDPENRLLARGSRYRMDAEMIRDQILAVSGQLNPKMYGHSVKPPQPPGLWEMVSMAEPMSYVADTDDNIYRRSLYTYWRRGMPPPQMTIMNAPSREFCVARRERTNTPLQALLLMNEQEYFNAAKACVRSTLNPDMDTPTGLRLIYEKITSQVPTAERVAQMTEALAGFREIYSHDPALTEALTPTMGDAPLDARVDLSAWTMVTHSLMNLELAKVRR